MWETLENLIMAVDQKVLLVVGQVKDLETKGSPAKAAQDCESPTGTERTVEESLSELPVPRPMESRRTTSSSSNDSAILRGSMRALSVREGRKMVHRKGTGTSLVQPPSMEAKSCDSDDEILRLQRFQRHEEGPKYFSDDDEPSIPTFIDLKPVNKDNKLPIPAFLGSPGCHRSISEKTVAVDIKRLMAELKSSGIDATPRLSEESYGTVGSDEWKTYLASRLWNHRNSICIQGDHAELLDEPTGRERCNTMMEDFPAAFGPQDMRCLALVSHDGMKSTMRNFVVNHKHLLKKFRLTGTNTTMTMLRNVFADSGVEYGPTCKSGPLGGDAELVHLMTNEDLGGIVFFRDPMTSHPHQADIVCLVRQALVHNTLLAMNPTSAICLMRTLRMALVGEGKPELIPSFFFSLQSPTVDAYKATRSNHCN